MGWMPTVPAPPPRMESERELQMRQLIREAIDENVTFLMWTPALHRAFYLLAFDYINGTYWHAVDTATGDLYVYTGTSRAPPWKPVHAYSETMRERAQRIHHAYLLLA
jgi:hypothetical protein